MAKQAQGKPSGARQARGCLTFIVVVIAIVIAVSAAGGSSKTPKQQAQGYIKSMSKDINTVQASVQSVQGGILILKKSGGNITQSEVNQFAQLAQQAHDFIDGVRQDFATSNTSGNLGNAEVELFTAANDLKNAMGAVVAWTGNPNPATLAHFTSEYQNAVGEWNDGIQTVWSIAGESNPPTV
jgi:hypothetical protein